MTYSIEDFLNIRTAWASNFSPDGSKVCVLSNLSGTMQLYTAPSKGGDLRQITDFGEPVTGSYLPTTNEILMSMDEGGNEKLQIWLTDDEGEYFRKVVHDPEFIHRLGGVTRDGSTIAYACNRRNGVDFDVWVHHLKTKEERCVYQRGGMCQPAGFSPDGRFLAVWHPSNRPGDNDIYLVDLHSDELIHVSPHDDDAEFGAPHWLPDGSAFFFSTDHNREFSSIARYDTSAASWKYALEFEWDADCSIDWPGKSLLVSTNEDGYSRIRLFHPETLAQKQEVALPGRGVAAASFSRDGRYLAYSYTSFVEPGDVWVSDTETGENLRVTTSPNPVNSEEFVDGEVHRFASFDDEEIPTFLLRPREFTGDRAPAVVMIHGGPEGQYPAAFSPLAQYFLHRGYAVVAPNVRGSIGYGKRFHHLDDVHKRLDSVRDLEALHGWMAAAGLDSGRAALYGGSYGGYMVLAGLAFQPDLWAAGIDVVGVSSLVTFLENTAAWRRKFREREYGSLEKDREFLIEASPITHVDQIKSPLFIIHGRNDPRVPVGEAIQIHETLTRKGISTELLIYEDEGHGLQKLTNRLDAYPKAMDFLDRIFVR